MRKLSLMALVVLLASSVATHAYADAASIAKKKLRQGREAERIVDEAILDGSNWQFWIYDGDGDRIKAPWEMSGAPTLPGSRLTMHTGREVRFARFVAIFAGQVMIDKVCRPHCVTDKSGVMNIDF